MSEHKLTPPQIQAFARHLLLEEKSAATMEKYLRDIRAFACWLGDREICKELTAEWKACLAEQGYAPASINAMLSALNSLLAYLDLNDCRVKFLKIQRRLFRDAGRELTKSDYQSLLDAACRLGQGAAGLAGGDHQGHRHPGQRSPLYHSGSRAAGQGRSLPQRQNPRDPAAGETLPQAAQICPKAKTASGAIFRTKSGKELGRRQIWAEMKSLCKYAGVMPGKVFPTICGTCLPPCFTGPVGTSSNCPTCWATAASKRRASIC